MIKGYRYEVILNDAGYYVGYLVGQEWNKVQGPFNSKKEAQEWIIRNIEVDNDNIRGDKTN